MTFLGDFHFIRPAWLLLALVVPWVWWLVRTSQDPLRGWRSAMDRELLAAMTVGEDARSRWRGSSVLVAWLLAVVAVAGPTWRPEPSPFADDPVPVVLVLKADQTMDLTDLAPSRMERARLKIADFARERKGLPLGLIAYAGSAHLVLPPTRDTSVIAAMAAEISPAIMPQSGDDLAGALHLAARTLGDTGGSIVVLADTAPFTGEAALRAFGSSNQLPVHFLAVARANTPELGAVNDAAAAIGASVQPMTPDSADIVSLVRRTAKAPVAIAATGSGTRWAEAGWWLVPVLAWISLGSFRRFRNAVSEETTA
jgi:Ca-activated chloride channel homolog